MSSSKKGTNSPSVDDEEEEKQPDGGSSTHGDGDGDGDDVEMGIEINHEPHMKRPSMLPEVTPELLREHEAQVRLTATMNNKKSMTRSGSGTGSSGDPNSSSSSDNQDDVTCLQFFCPCYHHHDDEHGEPEAICGIPYYLFMIMAALVAAVTAGTVLAVIYYDPSDGFQPPEYPSPAPTTMSAAPTMMPSIAP
jgi:hypothetical protein